MILEHFGYLIHQSSKIKAYRKGLSLHAVSLKIGIHSDIIISNHVLNMYVKCGKLTSARQMFDEMSGKNVVSWSAIISGYDHWGEPVMALRLFSQLQLVPNEHIFASSLSACSSLVSVTDGQQIHAQSLKFGFSSISFVANALITMYMKCNRCGDAMLIHAETSHPNIVSYNALITGFLGNQLPGKGFQMFKLMHQQGLVPDCFTFIGILRICSEFHDFQGGESLHCLTIKLKLDTSTLIGNVLVTMYSKCKLLDDAEKVFMLIDEKDLISWNTFMTVCCNCDDQERALWVFRVILNESNLIPDGFTFASVLSSCSALASLRHGKEIHAHIIRTNVYQDMVVGNALVNMYAKCGSIGHAFETFRNMRQHNVVSWNTIIVGFGAHGLGRRALELFDNMKKTGLRPNAVTFSGLLAACNHAGMVEEGKFYFNSMEATYGVSPDVDHFSSLIDLLGRAGRLDEAGDYFRNIPFGHDRIALGALLSACRLHGDVMGGERLAREILELEPVATSPYILLSNLYASDKMWDGVAKMRKVMKGSGLKKEPGQSMIEANGVFQKFIVGDFSHSRIKEIEDMLSTLSVSIIEVDQLIF